jgi:hypothetical protein
MAAIEPVADQRVDQRRRMLAVAVHEQHRAIARMIESCRERRLLAEIARKRDDLHVEHRGRQGARDLESVVAAAVVHVNDLDRKSARRREALRHLDQLLVQARQPLRLVVQRYDNRQAVLHAPPYSRRRNECRAGGASVLSGPP